MSIALELGNRLSGTYSMAQKLGRMTVNTEKYVVYHFSDGSELVFHKTSTGKVKPRSYTIYN